MAERPYYEYIGEAWNDPERARTATGKDDLDEAAEVLYWADEPEDSIIRDPKAVAAEDMDTGSPMDWAGDKAMNAVMKWGEGIKKGERIGKSAENTVKAILKERNPEKVHFHRTKAEYADDIERDGLKLKSKNYGENTGDADEYSNVLWLGDQPDEIPVLRRYGDGYPRYADEVETFKVTEPKEVYEKRQRFQFPKGRGSGRMESRTGKQNSWTNEGDYKIDIYGEDIGPEYLQRMPKDLTPEQLEELDRFNHWKARGAEGLDQTRMLAADRGSYQKASFKTSPKHRMQGMEAAAKYTKAQPEYFDWDRYAEELNGVRGMKTNPHDAAVESYKPASSDRPWNDERKSYTQKVNMFPEGHISNAPDQKFQMESNNEYAKNKSYERLKNNILNDPNSVMSKYNRMWRDYGGDTWQAMEKRLASFGYNIKDIFNNKETKALFEKMQQEENQKVFEKMMADHPEINEYVKNFLAKKWGIY